MEFWQRLQQGSWIKEATPWKSALPELSGQGQSRLLSFAGSCSRSLERVLWSTAPPPSGGLKKAGRWRSGCKPTAGRRCTFGRCSRAKQV